MGEAKRSWIAYLLWFLCVLGVCGAHRFYVGEIGWGVVYLLTFGFCGIGQFIDLFSKATDVGSLFAILNFPTLHLLVCPSAKHFLALGVKGHAFHWLYMS